jgi:hypothetical protein
MPVSDPITVSGQNGRDSVLCPSAMKKMTTDKPMALHRREIIFSLIPFAFLLFRQRGFYLMPTPVDPMGWIDQGR